MSYLRRKDFKSKITFSLGIICGIFLVYFLTNLFGFFVPQKVLAFSIDPGFGATLGLGTADLLETVIGIIQWVLGILGLIAVIIIIYGGFIWMTAAGNEEKIKKAKKILINALVGLAIILLAWAIVYFVMGIINNATNGGGPQCDPQCIAPEICCPGNYCYVDCGGPPGGFDPEFIIRSFATACKDPQFTRENVFLCSSIAINFNNVIQIPTVEDAVTNGELVIEQCGAGSGFDNCSDPITKPVPLLDPQVWSGSAPQGIDSEWVAANKSIVFYHIPYLFEAFTYYRLTITENISDTDGREITKCEKEGGAPIPGCDYNAGDGTWTWIFQTNDQMDDIAPEIVQAYPEFDQSKSPPQYPDRNVSMAPIIWANFSEMIDPITVTEANITVSPIDINKGPLFDPTTGEGGEVLGSLDPDQYNVFINGNGNGFQWQLEDDPDIWPQPNYLEAYTWYEVNVDNIYDLCSNEMIPAPTTWRFETNGNAPGVNFVYPPDGYGDACPDTEVFVQFNTSMYDLDTSSCGVDPFGGGGFVTLGTLTNNPGRLFAVEDDYPGPPADPNQYCKKYSWKPTSTSLPLNTYFDAYVDTRMIIDSDQNTLEADWDFGVTDPDNCANPPYITELSPNYGPAGQCFSVQGNYFGDGTNPQDKVELGGNQTPVNPGAWTNNNISTRVPAGTTQGVHNVEAFVYHPPPIDQVLDSNEVQFQVDPGTFAGPCIDYITPTSGYEGTGVTIVGSEFDPASTFKEVWFTYHAFDAGYSSWGNTQITTNVPIDAGSGDVNVENDGGMSNGVNFDVIPIDPDTPYVINDSYCSDGPPAVYASPSPRINQQNICLNAVASARFSEAMNPGTFDNSTIFVEKCTDPEPNPCTTKDPPLGGAVLSRDYNFTDDMIILDPPGDLESETWYEATITTGVQNLAGIGIANDYVWQFKTKIDTGPCPVSGVGVTPPGPITLNWGGSQVYDSVPTGPDCQIFGPNDYTWGWNSTTPNVADIVGSPTGPQATASSSNIQEGSTWIQATTEGVTGQSQLNVDLTNCEADPTLCTDPDRDGCPDSQCINGTCTPIIEDISPTSGPIGQYVTVDGCWFGAYDPTVSKVEFLGPPVVQAKWPEACGPDGSTWLNSTITIEVPEDETPPGDDAQDGPMRVTVSHFNGDNFDATNDSNGPSVSDYDVAGGVAVNLCPLNPASGRNNTPFTATGEGFGIQDGGDNISFLDNVGGRVAAPISTWIATQIEGTVPATAITSQDPDGVYVTADGNTSNQQPFIVSCSTDSDCITGCCYANQCSDPAFCSSGGPGDLCRIPSNLNCPDGPGSFPGGYDCISDTGDIESTQPPPPEPPPFGDDCRVCCEPGQTYNNLTCTADIDDCTGTERGLYCGCTTDLQCGDPQNIGCGDTSPRCCYERPAVESTDPFDGETDVCLNSLITVTFDRLMDSSSFDANFELLNTEVVPNETIPGSISSYNQSGKTVLVFTPTDNLEEHLYKVVITGDDNINDGTPTGVLSIYQVGMNGTETYTFTTGLELCQIDRVEVNIEPPGEVRNFDLYTCSHDDCANDQDGMSGNQHIYTAQARDASGTPLNATYNWDDPEAGGVLDVVSPLNSPSTLVSTMGPNGQENIQVTADAGDQGQASTIVVARVDACDNPWPTSSPYVYPDGVGMTEPTNFETYYCKDGGLPDVDVIAQDPAYTSKNGEDEMIREIFFSPQDGSGDVVGIRVMENEGFLSARAWFNNMFPEDTSAGGSSRLVDGYEALQVGRTVYVAATNLSGGTLYPNIYLISYNDNAQGSTANIYSQLLDNWYFNTNVTGNCASEPNKQCIIRDTKRVTNLGEIAFGLLQYEESNENFPPLTAGSYLEGTTTSRWPSWVSALGNELGTTLPIDPVNIFDPPCSVPPYDPSGTCWNDFDKVYTCPGDHLGNSHIYQYYTSLGGGTANLYANLEYAGTGTWITGSYNPCTGYPGSSCACFDYHIDSSDDFGIRPYWAY